MDLVGKTSDMIDVKLLRFNVYQQQQDDDDNNDDDEKQEQANQVKQANGIKVTGLLLFVVVDIFCSLHQLLLHLLNFEK